MSQNVHFILFATTALVLFTSLFIKRIHRSFLSEPALAMLLGLVLNISAIQVFRVEDPHSLILAFTRITIVVALISTALQVKHAFVLKQKRNLSLMVPLAMVGMWLVSSLLFYFLSGRDLLFSLLIGAIVTPTDPVVASSMLSGELASKLIPERVRSALSFEAGANDGLAFPMVMLPLLLMLYPAGHATGEFFLKVILWENLAAIILAGMTGYLLGRIYHYFHKKHQMDEQAIIGFSLALTFFVYSLFEILGTNSIVSVFAAGFFFNSVLSENENVREEKVQQVFERFLVVPVFFLFGLTAPFSEWLKTGPVILIFALLLMLVRRIPVFLALRPLLKGYRLKDILLMGWFGPIGVAALFYALHVEKEYPVKGLWIVVSFVVFTSTLVHGLTRYSISKKYNETPDLDSE